MLIVLGFILGMNLYSKFLFQLFIFTLALAGVCLAQYEDDGRYRPSDEGRYYPDNSGVYVPDNSGAYDPYAYGSASRAAPAAYARGSPGM